MGKSIIHIMKYTFISHNEQREIGEKVNVKIVTSGHIMSVAPYNLVEVFFVCLLLVIVRACQHVCAYYAKRSLSSSVVQYNTTKSKPITNHIASLISLRTNYKFVLS